MDRIYGEDYITLKFFDNNKIRYEPETTRLEQNQFIVLPNTSTTNSIAITAAIDVPSEPLQTLPSAQQSLLQSLEADATFGDKLNNIDVVKTPNNDSTKNADNKYHDENWKQYQQQHTHFNLHNDEITESSENNETHGNGNTFDTMSIASNTNESISTNTTNTRDDRKHCTLNTYKNLEQAKIFNLTPTLRYYNSFELNYNDIPDVCEQCYHFKCICAIIQQKLN